MVTPPSILSLTDMTGDGELSLSCPHPPDPAASTSSRHSIKTQCQSHSLTSFAVLAQSVVSSQYYSHIEL